MSSSKKIILLIIFLVYLGSLALVLNSFGDRDAGRNLVMLGLPTLVCGLAFYYAWRLRPREFLFALVPLAITAVLLEAGFSLYLNLHPEKAPALLWGHGEDLGEYFAYRPHHYTLYTLREGYRNDAGTIHNEQGFRDAAALPEQKPPCEFRIFFMGGSTTYTQGIKDNKKIFSARLEQDLNTEASKRGLRVKFRVVNAGLGAATSAENLSRLIYMVLPYEPDLLVIQHGLNDVLPRLRGTLKSDYSNYRKMWCSSQNPYDFFLKRWVYDIFIKNSRLITFLAVRLNLLEPNTIRGVITNNAFEEKVENLSVNDTRYFKRNTELMVLVAGHEGSDVIIASCPYNQLVEEARLLAMPGHNRVVEQAARDTGAYFFDLYERFDKSSRFLPDGLHVSQEGSDLKEELYYEYLDKTYDIFHKAVSKTREPCGSSE